MTVYYPHQHLLISEYNHSQNNFHIRIYSTYLTPSYKVHLPSHIRKDYYNYLLLKIYNSYCIGFVNKNKWCQGS